MSEVNAHGLIATGMLTLGLAGLVTAVVIMRRWTRLARSKPEPSWGPALDDTLVDGEALLALCRTSPLFPRMSFNMWLGRSAHLIRAKGSHEELRLFCNMEGLNPPDAPSYWLGNDPDDFQLLWCRVARLRELKALWS